MKKNPSVPLTRILVNCTFLAEGGAVALAVSVSEFGSSVSHTVEKTAVQRQINSKMEHITELETH